MKPYIVRFTDGYTTRIDAPSMKAAMEIARATKRESGAKVKRLVPMTPDWSARIRG